MFRASSQIEYNNAVIAKTDGEIKACEEELQKLREITANGGAEALGVNGEWYSLSTKTAIRDRAKWLLDKMGKNVDKLNTLESENALMVTILSSGHR